MPDVAHRIGSDAALGRARRGLDLALGSAAVAPILAAAGAAWTTPADVAALARQLAVIWAGSLLCFFSGVRRGLSFSEAGGASARELATMLLLFSLGGLTVLARSPGLAALGFVCVGGLDALSARRLESPPYFSVFRPVQMALCASGMLAVQLAR